MAKYVFKAAYALINSVDLSNDIKSMTIDFSSAEVDQTAMGDTFTNFMPSTLKGATVDIEFYQDFAGSQVVVTLASLLGVSTAVHFRASTASLGATNPKWAGNMMLTKYVPAQGSVGDAAMASAHFVCVDGTGLVRATS